MDNSVWHIVTHEPWVEEAENNNETTLHLMWDVTKLYKIEVTN